MQYYTLKGDTSPLTETQKDTALNWDMLAVRSEHILYVANRRLRRTNHFPHMHAGFYHKRTQHAAVSHTLLVQTLASPDNSLFNR